MESKVKYMSPEEIRGLPTSEIASMTMLSGDVILIGPNTQQDLSKSRQLFIKCDNNCIPSVQGSENVVLRAKKETTVKEEDGVEKVQETVEIDVEPQPEGEDKKQEPLRGPDGKLLNDILTGADFGEQEQGEEQQPPLEPQPQANEEENQQNNYPNPQEEQGQYYVPEYDPNQVPQTNEEQQQYAPEENNMGYEGQEQYYPPEEQYYDPEQYPGQDMNQQVPEQYAENEYYPQEYVADPNNPDQNNMYPTFEDENNQQIPPQEYQQPMNVPEQQGYVPEVVPMEQPPLQEPIQPAEQPPMQPENYPQETQPVVQPEVQPPVQQPVIQPEMQPQEQQTVQPVMPPVQQPVQPPVQPPSQQPIQPPAQKPVQPSVRPQIPPKQPFPGQRPGIKIMPVPSGKRQVVQIKFGFDPRMPQRPGMRPMFPIGKLFPQPVRPQPKRQGFGIGFIPARPQPKPAARVPMGGKKKIVINPIGNIIDFVHDVMAPMAVRRVGLRSTNPNATVKTAQKEDVKAGTQQGTVLRARRKEYASQEENLCPDCCEECYGNQNQYASQYGYNNQYGQNFATTKVFRGRGAQYGPCRNFNYHEIVETSDNSKTHVVVKKGGITIKPIQ